MRLVSAHLLARTEVVDTSGQSLGHIVDFMLDTQARRVVYAVLSHGGVLGLGIKLLAVPPQALELDGSRRRLTLTVDPRALEEAAGIDRDNPPATADRVLQKAAQRGERPPTSRV
jgi:hypothetical protein